MKQTYKLVGHLGVVLARHAFTNSSYLISFLSLSTPGAVTLLIASAVKEATHTSSDAKATARH